MSMLRTLATVAAGAMVARGVGKVMNRGGMGGGGMGGGMGGGGLGGMLGGMMRGNQSGGGLGGLGGMLGGGNQMGGQMGRGTQMGGNQMGGQMGGLGGGLGGLLSGARGGGGGLGGLLESLGGGAAGAAMGGAMGGNAHAQQQQLPPQPSNGSLGDALNSAFDGFGVEPTNEQEDQARILLRAMINAAKSDGQIDQGEREKLLGHLGDASPEEVEFVKAELAAPLDMEGLVASVPAGMQQQVYLMSLMAIDLDTPEEAKYLDSFARALNLSPEVCNAIHDKLGAPRLYS